MGPLKATLHSGRRLYVPRTGRVPDGIWMHSACRPTKVLLCNLLGHLSRVSMWLMPGVRGDVSLPFADEVLDDVLRQIPGASRSSEMIALVPTDTRRARILFVPLGADRRPLAFVKATLDPPNDLARQALMAVREAGIPVGTPSVREVLTAGEWWITVEDPLPQVAHRPADLSPQARHTLVAAIRDSVPSVREGLVLAHGDFGPWNVREFRRGGLVVLDWEYATWAPPATDEIWHAVTYLLARGERSGAAAGRAARNHLSVFYSDTDLDRAVSFLESRWEGAEPPEIRSDVPKSKSLMKSESQIRLALSAVRGG